MRTASSLLPANRCANLPPPCPMADSLVHNSTACVAMLRGCPSSSDRVSGLAGMRNYGAAFAFSNIPSSHRHRRRLTACCPPRGSDTRFPRSVPRSITGLGACFRPRCMWVTRHLFTRDAARIRYLFGSSALLQPLSLVVELRSLSQIQILSPYRLASTHPACGCQEGLSLALDTPRHAIGVSLHCPGRS